MKKKVLSMLVTIAMLFSMFPATALAAEDGYVAQVGETPYATFSDAMTAANAMTGNVVVDIYGAVEFVDGMELNGRYDSITFNKGADGASITINQTAGGDYLEAHGKTVAFNDLTLAKANPAWVNNSGHMGNYFSIQGGTVTYNRCVFPDGACTSNGTATYYDCDLNNENGEYSLWVYSKATVTVDSCDVLGTKGIKMYCEGGANPANHPGTVTIKNTTFSDNITAKAAVAATYGEKLVLYGNTYNNSTPHIELNTTTDSGSNGIIIEAKDSAGNDITSTLTCTPNGTPTTESSLGVLVTDSKGVTRIYTTVAEAVKNAKSGDTVTLLHNSTETVQLPEGVKLDKNNHEAGDVTETVPVAYIDADGDGVQDDGEKSFTSLNDAFITAVDGQTIVLLANATPALTSQHAITKASVIDLGGNTLTLKEDDLYFGTTTFKNGTIVVDPSVVASTAVFWMFQGQTLIFDNVEIVATSVSGTYLIGTNGGTGANIALKNCSKITIDNDTATNLIAVIAGNGTNDVITIDNSTINVSNIVGRVALGGSYTVEGTSVINAEGVKEGFYIRANQSLSIEGTSEVTVKLNPDPEGKSRYGINLADPSAIYTKADTATVNANNNREIAKIGNVTYPSVAAALNAVADGETITLLDAEGSENKKEIEFDKTISFTITGKAPNYALPVVTFQNATVNIKDAEILIPELDARRNATINVIDSKVYDAGDDSIVKSYYNGAINISGTSEVYTMQVTTMGYITISDTAKLHATWQTNVYGNGLITVEDTAVFNTAALQLTGKDYSGRDNTNADRVGKPATIVVDGATFNVGKVLSSNGDDYSYNSGYGVNIGTESGKKAELNVVNGGKVNIYMANGQTANIGAGGTVNNGGTITVSCRAEGGTATLVNNGTITLTNTNATLTAPEGLTVVSGVDDTNYKVVYANGTYKLVAEFMAEVNGTKYKTLEAALNNVATGQTVTLLADCAENVTVAQAEGVKITIDGNGKTMTGSITVDGKSQRYDTAALTIKNVNFDAAGISTDACINLGVSGNNNTRYTNHVTVQDCTFTDSGNPNQDKVAVKSYTGGDKNLQVIRCTADNTMHSLLQVTNVEEGLVVDSCTVKSKNGINLNSSAGAEIKNSTIEVSGYAVRIGAGSGGGSGRITLTNNVLKTNNTEGDAAVVIRGAAVTQVDLAMTKNAVSGNTHISGTVAGTKISANANYWDGKAAPVVFGTAVEVTNYYSDMARTNLVTPGGGSSGGGGGGSSSSGDYQVTVDSVKNGKVTVSPSRADKGDTVTITVKPNDGYQLDKLTVTDKNGNTVKLTSKGSNKYTFTMPVSKVTVEASFAKTSSSPVDSFLDVNTGAWYYDAVKYAVENGLMSGTGTYTFEPNTTLSRGMIAQMLYALEGKPSVSSANNFTDVSSSDWYDKAASWAQSKGIITGYEDGRFGPNDPLTREQLALILYNYAKSEGHSTSTKADLSKFADDTSTSPWAQQAMSWAVGEGLLSGRGVNMLYPTGTATRAEVAQIMMNFCENVAK